MKVKLKGIEVAMGDKSVNLTITEAQELRKQLNELFGEKITTINVPSPYPVYIEREVWPWWKHPSYQPSYPYSTAPNTVQVYCCAE